MNLNVHSLGVHVLSFNSLFEHFEFYNFIYMSGGVLTGLCSEAIKQSMELVKLKVTFYKIRVFKIYKPCPSGRAIMS